MYLHWFFIQLMALGWVSHAAEDMQDITISQTNFGTVAVKLVTEEYQNLLTESKALEPNFTACDTLTTQKNTSCHNCINQHKWHCLSRSGIMKLVYIVGGPLTGLGATLVMSMADFGEEIANGAPAVFSKFGMGAVNGLKNGFNAIGEGFSNMGNTLKSGFVTAFNSLKYAFNMKTWMNSFIDLFVRKRRSERQSLVQTVESQVETNEQDVIQNALELQRYRRDSPGTRIARCINETCPVCLPFYNEANANDSYTVYQKICGNALIDQYLAIQKEIKQAEQFYHVLTNSTQNILKQVRVGKTTYRVYQLVAFDGTKYVTYYPTQIIFNPWTGTDAGYMAIARYLLNTY